MPRLRSCPDRTPGGPRADRQRRLRRHRAGYRPRCADDPWHAAGASAVAFTIGSRLPLIAILIPPANLWVAATFTVVVLALAVTGAVSVKLGSAGAGRAVARLVGGGTVAMAVTFGIGQLVGATVG